MTEGMTWEVWVALWRAMEERKRIGFLLVEDVRDAPLLRLWRMAEWRRYRTGRATT